jgi:hypothetical protein
VTVPALDIFDPVQIIAHELTAEHTPPNVILHFFYSFLTKLTSV